MWGKHLCAETAHAEHESEGLQIGMPAVSWVVCLVFESTYHPGPCMGVKNEEDELRRTTEKRIWRKHKGIFMEIKIKHLPETCFALQ